MSVITFYEKTGCAGNALQKALLIRRPLLKVGDECRVGFDTAAINAWIGLRDAPDKDLEACQRTAAPELGPVFYVQTAGGGAYPCQFAAVSSDADRCKSG